MRHMRKRDILTPIGITLGFLMIMMAIVAKDGRSGTALFFDVSSIFIVIGGIIASLLINFKREQIKGNNWLFTQRQVNILLYVCLKRLS